MPLAESDPQEYNVDWQRVRLPLAYEEVPMPKFMDVHHGMHGVTPEALQAAHQADLDIQGEEGVDFQRAWGDPDSGMVWCVSEAPNAEAVQRIHERAGHPATEIYPVPVEV